MALVLLPKVFLIAWLPSSCTLTPWWCPGGSTWGLLAPGVLFVCWTPWPQGEEGHPPCGSERGSMCGFKRGQGLGWGSGTLNLFGEACPCGHLSPLLCWGGSWWPFAQDSIRQPKYYYTLKWLLFGLHWILRTSPLILPCFILDKG